MSAVSTGEAGQEGTGVEALVGFQVKALQQVLRTAMDSALRESGITTSQFAVLAALRDLPGSSGASLAGRTFMSPQSLNEALGGLERRGLVSRSAHPTHGRIIEARLTESGLAALTVSDEIVRRIEQRMLGSLSLSERRDLARMLARCRGALEPHASAGRTDPSPRAGPARRQASSEHTAASESQTRALPARSTGP